MVEKRDRDLTVVFCGCVCFVELEVCVAFARIEMRRSGEESEKNWTCIVVGERSSGLSRRLKTEGRMIHEATTARTTLYPQTLSSSLGDKSDSEIPRASTAL